MRRCSSFAQTVIFMCSKWTAQMHLHQLLDAFLASFFVPPLVIQEDVSRTFDCDYFTNELVADWSTRMTVTRVSLISLRTVYDELTVRQPLLLSKCHVTTLRFTDPREESGDENRHARVVVARANCQQCAALALVLVDQPSIIIKRIVSFLFGECASEFECSRAVDRARASRSMVLKARNEALSVDRHATSTVRLTTSSSSSSSTTMTPLDDLGSTR
jgi:hypothetical protein